jgi:hypothetical protein
VSASLVPRVLVKLDATTYGGPVERYILGLLRESGDASAGMTTNEIHFAHTGRLVLHNPAGLPSWGVVTRALYRLEAKGLVLRERTRNTGATFIAFGPVTVRWFLTTP